MNVCCPPMTWMSNSRMDPEVPDPRASNCSSVNSPHASISSRFAHRLYRKRWASGALTREPLLVRLGEVPDRGREARKCPAHGEADGQPAAGEPGPRAADVRLPEGERERLARWIRQEVQIPKRRCEQLSASLCEGRDRIDLATHQRADRSMDDLGGAALRGEKRHVVRSINVWTRLTRRVLVSGEEDGGLAVAGLEPAARDDRIGADSHLSTDEPSRAVGVC